MKRKNFFFLPLSVAFLSMTLWVSCGKPTEDNTGKGPVEIELEEGNDLCGLIVDQAGAPIPEVVVSDGFQCVATDDKGVYQMKRSAAATHVFFTIPAEYKIPLSSSKYPQFYAKINATAGKVFRRDFSLEKSGKEKEFRLICIGDPQTGNEKQMQRYREEIVTAVRNTISKSDVPCYVLAMGDITAETPSLLSQFKNGMGLLNAPYFVTIGNHDKVVTGQEYTTDKFIDAFGPLNYSFDRGDVHFICLDNVIFSNTTDYSGGLSDAQIEWVRQDLSYVDKSKMVIVYYHMPIRGGTGNYTELIGLVEDYAEVHFMCGHTHYNENYINSAQRGGIYEHIHAAACGAWWHSSINGDGTPNGYAVYDVENAGITNWYYKGAAHDEGFQIRMHKGSDACGGPNGYYRYSDINGSFDANTVIANVFNADSRDWSVRLYEDGQDKGEMTWLGNSGINDKWSVGYHVGVVGRPASSYTTICKHLYWKQRSGPSVPDADIKVVATDPFGNVYEQTLFTAQDDFSQAKTPVYN